MLKTLSPKGMINSEQHVTYKNNKYKHMKTIKVNKMLAVFSLMIFCGTIQAQQSTVTMDEAVAIAIENHPSLEAAKLGIEKEKLLKSTAWDFGNTELFTAGEEIGNNSPDAVYTLLGIGQTGIDIFGIGSKNKLAQGNIELAESNLEVNNLTVKQNVQLSWSKAFITKKIYKSFLDIDSVYSGLDKAIKLRFETEAISELEFKSTTNNGRLISIQKEQAFTAYQMALQELNQWLQLDNLSDVVSIDIESLENQLEISEIELENHPLNIYWNSQLEVANAEQKVKGSKYLPKLSAQYGFQKIGGQTGYNSYQVGLQIPLIFNKTKGESKASKINASIIEQENMVKQLELKSAFKQAVTQFKQLDASWNYYKNEALPFAIEQRNGVSLSYKEGAMDYIAFLQNMKNAIQLEITTWKVLQQYLESKIQLEYFINKNYTNED